MRFYRDQHGLLAVFSSQAYLPALFAHPVRLLVADQHIDNIVPFPGGEPAAEVKFILELVHPCRAPYHFRNAGDVVRFAENNRASRVRRDPHE